MFSQLSTSFSPLYIYSFPGLALVATVYRPLAYAYVCLSIATLTIFAFGTINKNEISVIDNDFANKQEIMKGEFPIKFYNSDIKSYRIKFNLASAIERFIIINYYLQNTTHPF